MQPVKHNIFLQSVSSVSVHSKSFSLMAVISIRSRKTSKTTEPASLSTYNGVSGVVTSTIRFTISSLLVCRSEKDGLLIML